MSSANSNQALCENGRPCWVTPECARVQGEIRDLAAALAEAALAEYEGLVPSFRKVVAEFRDHLREHVEDVEGPGGVCHGLLAAEPLLAGRLNHLCRQHAELEQRLEGLERRLEAFDAADPQWERAVRQAALRLAEALQSHHDHGRALAPYTRLTAKKNDTGTGSGAGRAPRQAREAPRKRGG